MQITKIWSPDSEQHAFADIWRTNPIRSRPSLREPWRGQTCIEPGGVAPTLWFKNGGMQLRWVPWAHSVNRQDPVVEDARNRSFGRRCLVLASALGLKAGDGELSLIPSQADYMFVGAIWRGSNNYAHEPDTVSLLTSWAPSEWKTIMDNAPVIVPVDRCLDWLNSSKDTIPLQGAPDHFSLRLDTVERSQTAA